MTTRVATPRRLPRQALWLREDAVRSAVPLEVDREAGIIHGVKVLGTRSSNGRRYTAAAIQGAAQLYEGVLVNVDHPEKKPTQSRSAYDRLGKLQNVRVEPDGLYADLHLLTSHPLARRLMEAAEKMPDAFGLSHNAQGNGRTEEGVFVVEEITEVRHVDLVADPATTQSLCESRSHSMAAKKPGKKKPVRARIDLSEMYEGDSLLDAPAAAPVADSGDHTDDLFNAFKKLKETDPEKANKILAMLKAEMSAAGDDEEVEEEDDQEEADDEMEADDEEVEESRRRKPGKGVSLQEEVRRLRLEKRCRRLLAEAGVAADEDLVEALADMGGEARARKHLAWIRANLSAAKKGQKPRSQSPGLSLTESRDGDERPVHQRIPKDLTEQLNWLRN